MQYTHARPGNTLTDLYKGGFLKVEVVKPLPGMEGFKQAQETLRKHLADMPSMKLHPHAMVSSSVLNSIRHGDVHHERHGDTFHVHARTADEGMRAAERASARRGGKDGVRYGNSSQQ